MCHEPRRGDISFREDTNRGGASPICLPTPPPRFVTHETEKKARQNISFREDTNRGGERSTNGTNYTTIATLAAKNLPGTQQYNYKDNNVRALTTTVLYYRLKQKDATGKYTYSNIVALPLDDRKSLVMLYPNPVNKKLNLTISVNKAEKLQACIIDNTGKIVQRYMMNVTAGSTTTALDVSSLATGLYYFDIKGEGINERKAFVKQ